jgi:hypothetical protein
VLERHGPNAIIDHTRSSEVVLEDLKAHGPCVAGIFDTTGAPTVNTLLGQLISSFGEGKYLSVLLPLGGVTLENWENFCELPS